MGHTSRIIILICALRPLCSNAHREETTQLALSQRHLQLLMHFGGGLLGLMAVRLLLLALNTVSPSLNGQVKIYSDCLGTLSQVAELLSYQIPSRCRHSDILKTILVNCGGLSFHCEDIHIETHQDNHTQWEGLTQAAQLNAACNARAKVMHHSQDVTNHPHSRRHSPLNQYACLLMAGR
jgi:hypothetical protein